jgi:hypothetical protein
VSTRAFFLAALLLPLLALDAKRAGIIARPFIMITNTSVQEGDSGMKMFTVAVSFTGGGAPIEVDVSATGNGGADASDFVFTPVHLTLTPNVEATVSGFILGDRRYERDEQILVTAVSHGGGLMGLEPGVVTILDDDQDQAAHVTAQPVVVAEGNGGWWTVDIPVSLDRALDTPVSIAYQPSGGIPATPARPWGDYRPIGGTVTFAPGQTATVIPVEINGDSAWEPDAGFTVALGTADPAFVLTPSVTVDLENDDAPSVVTIEDARTDEGQTGRHVVSLRAAFEPPAPPYATVNVQVVGGTARAGEDFEGQTLRLVPPPGGKTVTFGVTIASDTTPECDEGVIVAYQAFGTGDETMKEARLLIADDDGHPDAGDCPDPFATRSEPVEPAPDDAGAEGVPDGAGEPPPAPSGDGCACGLAGGASSAWPAALALAAIALRGRRRRS